MTDAKRPGAGARVREVSIRVLGIELRVPAGQPLLRGFQRLCPEAVSRGRFCWNHECGSSKFYYRLPGQGIEQKARACRFEPVDGMEVTQVSAELRHALRELLGDAGTARTAAMLDGEASGAEAGDEDDPFPEIRFKDES